MKRIISILLIVCLTVPLSFAATSEKLVTRNDNSDLTKVDLEFSNFDSTGNYIFKGIDVGIFESTNGADYTLQSGSFHRVLQSSTTFSLNLGSLSSYDYAKTYKVAYRIIYEIVGTGELVVLDEGNSVKGWKKVQWAGNDLVFFRNRAPVITSVSNATTQYVSEESGHKEITLDFDGTDDQFTGSVLYKINGGSEVVLQSGVTSFNNYTKDIDLSAFSEGTYTFTFWLKDDSGFISDTKAVTVIVDKTNPIPIFSN